MNSLPLDPDLMRAPWRGPRLGGFGLAQIMRDPAAADESVLGFPVRWRSDAAPLVMLGTPPAVLEGSLSNDEAWQTIPLPPLPKGATGHVLLTTMDWRPFHGTPYSGRLVQPLTRMNATLQTLGVSTLTQRPLSAPPPAASHTAAALQTLVDRVFKHQPQVLHRAYLPASPAPAQTSAPGGQSMAMLRPQPLCFAFASCQYPAGVLDARPAQASLQRLADRCVDAAPSAPSAPQCVLFIGDQIYADATYGLLDATRLDDRFRSAYAHWLDMKPLRVMLARVPVHCMLDDHEIEDNWEPAVAPNPPGQDVFPDGLRAFLAHQCPDLRSPGAPAHLWRTVTLGAGHQLFMLDTRSERDPRPWAPGLSPPQIMGAAQREALHTWLRKTNSPVRWIASPVWLLPRPLGRPDAHGHLQPLDPALCDGWPGYTASLDGLLGLLASENIEHVVLLCGDAHLAGHTVLTLHSDRHPGKPLRVDVLHCPALYAPFPFANAQPHQFLLNDTLSGGTGNDTWNCTVHSTLWQEGDGFVSVAVDPTNNRITAVFDTPSPRTVHIP